jgi:hypothetical protein
MEYMIKTNKMINGVTVAASAAYDSAPIDLSQHNTVGYFSYHVKVTGSGTVKFEVLCSNEDVINETSDLAFTLPTTGSSIVTGLTAGTYFDSFTVPACKWMKVRMTETGGLNSAVGTLILGWQ